VWEGENRQKERQDPASKATGVNPKLTKKPSQGGEGKEQVGYFQQTAPPSSFSDRIWVGRGGGGENQNHYTKNRYPTVGVGKLVSNKNH